MRVWGLALIGLGISSLATAQLQPNATSLAGSWESKIPKHADTIHYKLEIDGETQSGTAEGATSRVLNTHQPISRLAFLDSGS